MGCTAVAGAEDANIADAVERVDPAVVTVRSGKQGGSGFIINASGQIVTCAHVVGKASRAQVKLADGEVGSASVTTRDKARDLAVLQFSGDVSTWAELGSSTRIKLGEQIAAIGAPLGLEHSVTTGGISSRNRVFGSNRYLQIDAALNPGNSGGPVVDKRGAIIGVNTVVAKRAENVGFAIASEVLVAFLREHGVEYDTVAGDSITPAARAPGMPDAPVPLQTESPVSLALVIAVAALVSALVSAVVSMLVMRVGLLRHGGAAARSVGPQEPWRPPAEEDVSDIDITLE